MMLIGVKKGSPVEFAVPLLWRNRWLHAGGRIVREAEGFVDEPIAVSDLPAKVSAPVSVPLASVISPVVEVSPAPTTGTLSKRRR